MKTETATSNEPSIGADDWVRSAEALNQHNAQSWRVTKSELERMQDEFLSKGGTIQQIPRGVSGEVYSIFNNCPVKIVNPGNSVFTQDEIDQHQQKKIDKWIKSDQLLVEKIRELLPVAKLRKDLYSSCKCSDDKVQRILRTHFADDPLAAKFFRQSIEEVESMIAVEYPKLANKMSLTEMAKTLGVARKVLCRVIKAGKLKPENA